MQPPGWKQLLEGFPWYQEEDSYPIPAYSEFMPPPRLGQKPYGARDPVLFHDDDPWGWHVTEYEEALELCPGLEHLAGHLAKVAYCLGTGHPAHGIAHGKLIDNPYWPAELAERAGSLAHEKFVAVLSLALSRTQDDKGRIRWTAFGGSEQGPSKAFWKGCFSHPGKEIPPGDGLRFFQTILQTVYGEKADSPAALKKAGFRILPDEAPLLPYWREDPLPSWAGPLTWSAGQSLRGVKYLFTFQAFARLPGPVRKAYLAGELALLPFPGSLVFWGTPAYFQLAQELPLAVQIPLLHSLSRHEGPQGIRVPQSGWLHEARPGKEAPDGRHGPFRETFQRTHRWAKVHRDEDELALEQRPEKLVHVLFSTAPEDLGLYDKPMARNVQMWTHDFFLLLDGPTAGPAAIRKAERALADGGLFGYRFQYPAMRVGQYEVYWHRPVAAYYSAEKSQPVVLPDGPLGYLTAYRSAHPNPARPVELWPRLLQRDGHLAAVRLFDRTADPRPHMTTHNVRKLLDATVLSGKPALPRSLARELLYLPKHETLEDWLGSLPTRSHLSDDARRLADQLHNLLTSDGSLPEALTYRKTATRAFEQTYWKTIAFLAEGKYHNKDNADCVSDHPTREELTRLRRRHHRDLDALGDYLIDYYARKIASARMKDKALVGELPFLWRTDFDFSWMGGWQRNQEGEFRERDVVVVIPGRDRRRAVIMADHYDTAYMADVYGGEKGVKGARIAASGADDNHSATAALMLAAPLFLAMSRAGKLGCDIWLIHLTGEEFPADCLGARHLCQHLVQGTLQLRLPDGRRHDLSKTRVQGLYVSDMIAHNNNHARNIFQIAPGSSAESFWLAYQAHVATEVWNRSTDAWNRRPQRRHAAPSRRSADGRKMPAVAPHPRLSGEVRLPYDPRSTLYNTDGQIFSDAGVPAVLFMENYDINRCGYHDTHDTMENIDLDYGAALAAIVIESVARAATQKAPSDVAGKSPTGKRPKVTNR